VHDDPYASFRSQRAKSSAARNESYLDTSEGVDLDPSEALRPGARVMHAKFGIGRVRTVEGVHSDVAVTVYFESSGVTKKLKASFLRPA